ncbi:MAG: hypothetical protein L0H73_18010 [Nitrococcus sp.]|nr:hypothetical protein [Nitrococcus sp.]
MFANHERVSRVAAAVVFTALALPPVRGWLEADMRLHMLVQFPLLAVTGVLLAHGFGPRWRARLAPWNRYGITGLLCAAAVSTFWMIPKALDDAISEPWVEAAKFLSLSLGVGFALAVSWRPAGMIGRGLFLGNLLPMLAVIGWLYLLAPVRLCNAYLPGQQESTGTLLIIIAVLGCLAWLGSFFLTAPADRARR